MLFYSEINDENSVKNKKSNFVELKIQQNKNKIEKDVESKNNQS